MKKLICIFVAVILISAFALPAFADTQPQVSAKSAILINQDNGDILFSKDCNTKRPMASTTKIMTALLTLEAAAVNNRVITITDQMVRVEGSSMGLLPGNQLSLKSLAAGMLTVSGNDAANSAAIAIGGTVQEFAVLMNRRAEELGLTNTHFVTPSGLDDDDHYTTARDLAVLASAAMKNPDFAAIAGSKLMNVDFISPDQTRRFTNHNKLLNLYSGCTGVKTGFTKKSGRCLVSAAEKNGVRLVAVTLNAPDDWDDHEKMLNYGFSSLVSCPIDDSQFTVSLPVVGGTANDVPVCGTKGSPVILKNGESGSLQRTVEMPKFLYAPIESGQTVGTVKYSINGKTIGTTTLITKGAVSAPPVEKNIFQSFWESLKHLLNLN